MTNLQAGWEELTAQSQPHPLLSGPPSLLPAWGHRRSQEVPSAGTDRGRERCLLPGSGLGEVLTPGGHSVLLGPVKRGTMGSSFRKPPVP